MSVPQQLDFADARAKIEGRAALRVHRTAPIAHRFERRPMDRVQARHRARHRQRTRSARAPSPTRPRRAASREATLTRLQQELASAKPALVLSGARGANALDLALAVAALNQANGAVGTTIRPGEPMSAFDGVARYSEIVAAVERMRAGQVPIAFVRGVEPGVQPAAPPPSSPRHSRRCRSRSASRSIPTRRPSCATSILPDQHSLESWGDAEAGTGTIVACSSRPWTRCSPAPRATADVLIQLARRTSANAATYAQKDYRSWLIGRFPGGMSAFTAALQKGIAAGIDRVARAVSHRARHRARAAGGCRPRATTTSSPTTRPRSATAAARTSRGCRSCPIRSQRCSGARGSRSIRRRRAKLGIERGDIVEVTTASGKVRGAGLSSTSASARTPSPWPSARGMRRPRRSIRFDGKNDQRDATCSGATAATRATLGVRAHDLLAGATDAAGGFALVSTKASHHARPGDTRPRLHRRLRAPARPRHRAGDSDRSELLLGQGRRARGADRRSKAAARSTRRRFPASRAGRSSRDSARRSPPTRRASSARPRRRIRARTRGCTRPTTGRGWRTAAGR